MKVSLTNTLFSALFLGALTACQSSSYQVNGTIEGAADGDTLFLTSDMQTGIPSDTLIVEDGKFSISGEVDSVHFCMIYSAKRNELNAPFFIEPGTIKVQISETPGASRVGGTLCNDEWQLLNDSVVSIGKEINRIAEHIYGNTVSQEKQQRGMEQIEKLNKRFSEVVIDVAEKNIDNEFGYFVLTYYPEDVIDDKNRQRLIEKLTAERRQRPAIKQIEATIRKAAKTAEGATIPNFTQQTPEGGNLSIMTEVGKNKITIIDFWASWCGPCRQEMPFMLSLYESNKERGLGIVGVSLDRDKDSWVTAIKKLQLPWPQMSDLKYWDNEVAKTFNITSIPHTIVVDQKGKILRRGLRGEQLKQFVESELAK
jgi:thiol-disulfide isomerase/thioredoxin